MPLSVAISRRFRRLTAITALAVYVLIVAGGVVRVTGSGLGCPDWPLCHGGVLPPPEVTAWIEFTHRVVAATAGLLMLITLIAAWRGYRHERRIVVPASLAVGLLVVQIPLGGLIVATELEPLIVAFHLGMAMLILAAQLLAAVAAHRPTLTPITQRQAAATGYPWLLGVTLAALFGLLLTGALVVGSSAQLACPDWPLCHAGVLPPFNASPLIGIHLLHRYTVVAVSALVVAVIVASLRQAGRSRAATGWTAALGGLFALQVAIGAIQVMFQLPAVWRALHLAAGSGVWASLVVLAALSAPGRPAPAVPRQHTTTGRVVTPSADR